MQFQHLVFACRELFRRWYNRSVGIWNWFAVDVGVAAAAASATFVCLLVCLFESAVLRKYVDAMKEREHERERKSEKYAYLISLCLTVTILCYIFGN